MSREATTTEAESERVEHTKLELAREGPRMPGSVAGRLSVVELFEPSRGGVPAHVALLAGGLLLRGWDVTVVGPPDAPVMDQLAAAGAHLVPMNIAHHPHPRDILNIRALLATCGDSTSLIHAHSTKAGLLAAWTSRLSGIPSVYTPHSWSFDRPLSPSVRAGYAAYERLTARSHRVVIAVAESERQQGLQHRIKEPSAIQVIHNGLAALPVAVDRDSARARLRVPSTRFVACWVGRHAPQKRPQDLPALAQELDRDGIMLVALGDGLAASSEAQGVSAAGGIVLADGSDPSLLYAAADVFVSTSAWEGHPITILEAMRAALPVVAYAVGGIPEQVEDSRTGYLVKPESLHELAARVALLAESDSLCRQMGGAGRARQAEQFSLDTMVGRTEDLYNHVLSSAAAGAKPRSHRV
jgi:glycosyltransferase involved in cell wall biosynthesis